MPEVIDLSAADARAVLKKLYRIYELADQMLAEGQDDGNDVLIGGVLFDEFVAAVDDFESHAPEAVVDEPLAFGNLWAAVTRDFSDLAA